jgi:hypothetical protein
MEVFESASVAIGEKSVTVFRVPESMLGDGEKAATVIRRAEIEFKKEAVLFGADAGEIFGNSDLRRSLRQHWFDPEKAKWSQWNMAEL